jgi:hypothetical protein
MSLSVVHKQLLEKTFSIRLDLEKQRFDVAWYGDDLFDNNPVPKTTSVWKLGQRPLAIMILYQIDKIPNVQMLSQRSFYKIRSYKNCLEGQSNFSWQIFCVMSGYDTAWCKK